MGRLWCDGLTLVRVARATSPKTVTLIYPYYNAPVFFREQLSVWRDYPPMLAANVRVIVVDDGSHQPAMMPDDRPCGLRLFRIDVDVPWNWLAARNIGAHYADPGWLLLTDMDHVVPAQTMMGLVYGVHDPSIVYALSRREHSGEQIHPHSASFLMTRQMFWQIGGYDETYSGRYGTDGLYRRRLMASAPIRVLTDELIRYEYVNDSSVSLSRKGVQPTDGRSVESITRSLPAHHRPVVLSFPHHEVRL